MRHLIQLFLVVACFQAASGLCAQGDSISHYFNDGTYESKHRIGTDFGQLVFGDVNFRYVYLISERITIEAGAGVLLGYGRLPITGPSNTDGRWFERDGGYSLFFSPRYRVHANGLFGSWNGFSRDVHLIMGLVIQHRSSKGVVMLGESDLDFSQTNFMYYGAYEFQMAKAFIFEIGTAAGVATRSGSASDALQAGNFSSGTAAFDFTISAKIFYLIK